MVANRVRALDSVARLERLNADAAPRPVCRSVVPTTRGTLRIFMPPPSSLLVATNYERARLSDFELAGGVADAAFAGMPTGIMRFCIP
jgi:hypothetical protein